MYCVYKHTCPNEKVYIGITQQNPIKRWANGFGYYRNTHFYNAILKYGWDNIKHEILYCDIDEDEAYEKEIELICLYKSNNPKFGYNHTNGGETIGKHTEETKRKISKANKGRIKSEKELKKMSESFKGKNNPRCRKIVLLDENDNVIERFDYIKQAAIKYDLFPTSVLKVCKGIMNHTEGYRFKYLEEVKQ